MSVIDWIGLDWIDGIDGIRLDSIRWDDLDGIGWDWMGLDWIDGIGLDSIRLD